MGSKSCDVVIVGAGATGLNAALGLGEARRDVVLIASGAANERTRIPDASGILDVGYGEVRRSGAEILRGPVRFATRCAGGFLVTADPATTVRGRKLLIITDSVHLPDLPGLPDRRDRLPAGVWTVADASDERAVHAAAAGTRVAMAIEEVLEQEDVEAAKPFSIVQERTVSELVQGSRRHGL